MYFAPSVLVAALAARALATPIARSPYVVKETHYVPQEWTKQDRSHGGKTIQLQIGLKQGRFDELDRHLYEGNSSLENRTRFRRADMSQYLIQIMRDMASTSAAKKWMSLLRLAQKLTAWCMTGCKRMASTWTN
jgi:hypothetical protein